MFRIMTQIFTIFLASVLLGVAYNMFFIPNKILSGGVTGLAMIIANFFPVNTGVMIFLLNIPIFLLGYFKLGRKFILYSAFSVAVTTIAMQYIPNYNVTSDQLLASVFGGVLGGIAIGLIFRSSGSTGGFDIISLIIRKKWDFPIGTLSFTFNLVVIVLSGFFYGWENALYTIIGIYALGRLIDVVHTGQLKVTITIISAKADLIKQQLLSTLHRGMTIWEAEGAYTEEKREVIMMVVTRYELSDIKNLVRKTDSHAFMNITETIDVVGSFRRD
ncbi:YitT family protein [Risungbinella massiliensis]|uniref:YitT family protein n=1 Tax=Risungbinella massiliensis TaxID=1329796 RepID=UPI000AD7DF9E|nr:YitT family protein [Risungbinella massiliensis]